MPLTGFLGTDFVFLAAMLEVLPPSPAHFKIGLLFPKTPGVY
jgi:hypothetical protein